MVILFMQKIYAYMCMNRKKSINEMIPLITMLISRLCDFRWLLPFFVILIYCWILCRKQVSQVRNSRTPLLQNPSPKCLAQCLAITMCRENNNKKKTKKPKPQRLKTFVVLTLLFEIDLHPKVRQIFSLFPDIKNYIYHII